MNALYLETEKIMKFFADKKINVEIYREHYSERDPEGHEPFRAYITSKPLGGLLAVNNGDGWLPAFPEKPNYPIKGRWFSPNIRYYKDMERKTWQHAVLTALDPNQDAWLVSNKGPYRDLTTGRAAARCNPFRASVMVAILRGCTI